ncbi:MAG TPA: hypothetical protein VF522_15410 [Ramlibacter sp.]|uniref:hypothetical protein n=1 Tax=Ramlibacter sp. TaxID=1917967 RepID=UPI002ED0225C
MEDDDFPFQAKFEAEMRRAREQLGLSVGDIYEDCAYHPVLCVSVDYEQDDISGISLIDGTHPRSCSLRHCGVRKLTVEEAWEIRRKGPADPEVRERIAPERRWWRG